MRGENLSAWVNTVTGGAPIERFPIRFAAVATDLESQQAVLIGQGLPGQAIQASAAVPGVHVPVPYPGGYVIDGGSTSLVPVRFARAMRADIVIAPEMAEADVPIAPPVSVSGMSTRDEQERAVLAGYRATRAALPKLLAAMPTGTAPAKDHLVATTR